jgi:hypothetical protein
VADNDATGIDLLSAGNDFNWIEGNFVAGNGRPPVPMQFAQNNGIAIDGSRNVVLGNTVVANTEDGVLIGEPAFGAHADETLVKRNHAARNGDDGVDVNDPGNTLAANTADDNGDLGIEAVAGVIDGGGNRASGNGNPLQCLNVFCR